MDNPHVEIIVRGIMIDQGEVLLCQNRKFGHLFLPGGHIDFNEPAKVALARELQEELGLEVKVGKLLGTSESAFDQPRKNGELKRHHEINLIFEMTSHLESTKLRTITSLEAHIQFIWRSIQHLDPQSTILPLGVEKLIAMAGASASNQSAQWMSDMQA